MVSRVSITASELARACERKEFKFDNALQRGFVWDTKRKSLLIDTLIRGFTVPEIYAVNTGEKVSVGNKSYDIVDVIDGKQRCSAIADYISDRYSLSGLEPFDINGEEVDLNKMKFSELPEDIQNTILLFNVPIAYLQNFSEKEIPELMSRLNNGKPLTKVENSRIKAVDFEGINKISSHPIFTEYLSASALNGYANEDIAIKTYITFYDADPCYDNARVKAVYQTHVFDEKETERINGILDKTHEVISIIENVNKTIFRRKIMRKNNLLAIISTMESPHTADEIAGAVIDFFNTTGKSLSISPAYNEASTNGTNHSGNVRVRMEEIRKVIDNIGEPSLYDNVSGENSDNNESDEDIYPF